MKILLWHGYLLGGTGSNVYTRSLAREWARAGHDVVLLCQEREADAFDLAGARVVRPELPDRLLPVFVLDRYEGLEPILLQEMTPEQRARYVEANAAAIRAELPADVVFTNHVLLGGPVGAATGARWAIKVHGSELEYSMRGRPELEAWGHASLATAEAVYVGSQHIANVLREVVGEVERVVEVPPGVDVDDFRPRARDEALAGLLEECRRDPPNPANAQERLPDEGNERRLADWFARDEATILYFGKMLYNKGVHVLLEALQGVEGRALLVGFGDYREELEQHARDSGLGDRVLFTGPMEHRHLVHLIPLCDVTVVPSIFPEAFGMVAAEAAAAGSPPLVARHSGLAEVAAGLEEELPDDVRHLVSFETGDALDLAGKLREVLALPRDRHAELSAVTRKAVVDRWSWASVAARLLVPFA